ncbi:MAG TPA: hypothetical protein VK488_13255 [Gaiellaceae bacterium]|nr:hypothetical protein [Gaiellaceae bacterium]
MATDVLPLNMFPVVFPSEIQKDVVYSLLHSDELWEEMQERARELAPARVHNGAAKRENERGPPTESRSTGAATKLSRSLIVRARPIALNKWNVSQTGVGSSISHPGGRH